MLKYVLRKGEIPQPIVWPGDGSETIHPWSEGLWILRISKRQHHSSWVNISLPCYQILEFSSHLWRCTLITWCGLTYSIMFSLRDLRGNSEPPKHPLYQAKLQISVCQQNIAPGIGVLHCFVGIPSIGVSRCCYVPIQGGIFLPSDVLSS